MNLPISLRLGLLILLALGAACGPAYRIHRRPKGQLPSLQNIPEKRQQFDLDGFRLTSQEKKTSDEFLDRHFPYADRPYRFEHAYKSLFKTNLR